MTVTATQPIIRYTYTGPGLYTFPFRIFKESDLLVIHTDSEGVAKTMILGTDYLVSFIEDVDGGTIQMINPVNPGGSLEVRRVLPTTQEVDWVNNDPLDAEILEDSFDRLVMMIQQLEVIITEGAATTNWKGEWQPSTYYAVNDIITSPVGEPTQGNLYAAVNSHVSGDTFSDDLASGQWQLALDVTEIEDLRDECEALRDECIQLRDECLQYAQQAANSAADAALYRDQCQVSEANAAASAQNAANCSQSASDSAAAAGGYANDAQLRAWEAEAEKLTADSYATEDEDVAVKIYTSNGDGTFTATDTSPVEYSSYHWSKKASSVVTGVASITWTAPLENTGDATDHIARIDPAKVAQWDGVDLKADYVINSGGAIDVDPDTDVSSLMLTAHANGPESGVYYTIYQKGYEGAGPPLQATSPRFQRAVEYRPGIVEGPRTFARSYYGSDGGWSPWKEEGSGAGGGGGLDWSEAPKEADFTAESGKGYMPDTTFGVLDMQLPAGTAGDQTAYKDYANNFQNAELRVIPAAGERIEGYAIDEVMIVNARGGAGELVYSTADRGWMLTDHTPLGAGTVTNKPFMQVQETKSPNVHAGAAVANRNIRPLNTVKHNDIPGAALSGVNVNLPAGEYYIEGFTCFMRVSGTASHIERASDGVVLLAGIPLYANSGANEGGNSPVTGRLVLSEPTEIRLTTWVTTAQVNDWGLGHYGPDAGVDTVYAEMNIWKLDTEIKKQVVDDPQMFAKKPLFHVREEQPSGSEGGSNTAGWNKRKLNTIVTDDSFGAVLANDEITLPAGEYYAELSAPSYQVSNDQLTLKKLDETMLLSGNGGYIITSGNVRGKVSAKGRFVLSETTTLKVDHYMAIAVATRGLGTNTSAGINEIFAEILIWKLDSVAIEPIVYSSPVQPISGAYVTGNIYGGELEYVNTTQFNVKPVSCMSDDNAMPLFIDATTLVTLTPAADTVYNAFICRLTDTSIVIRTDTDVDGANLGVDVTHKRWLGFVATNTSGEIKQFIMQDNQVSFGNAIDARIPGSGSATPIQIDHSVCIPEPRIKGITYGVHRVSSSGAVTCTASMNANDTEYRIGSASAATTQPAGSSVWWDFTQAGGHSLPFSTQRWFNSATVNVLWLVKEVTLKR